jgi:hypothetical protein
MPRNNVAVVSFSALPLDDLYIHLLAKGDGNEDREKRNSKTDTDFHAAMLTLFRTAATDFFMAGTLWQGLAIRL